MSSFAPSLSFPQLCVVLIHQPQFAGFLDCVEVPGIPPLIVQATFNAVKPLLSADVHRALVNKRQKGLPGFQAQRGGMAQDYVHLPAAAGQDRFDPVLDGSAGLLVRPPAAAPQEAVLLVYAVCPANCDAAFPSQLVHLAV